MLTDEERQRIEDEEQKRLAEEQYRAEVRSKLGAGPEKSDRSRRRAWVLGSALGLVLAVPFGAYLASNAHATSRGTGSAHDDTPVVPKTRWVPVSQKIATGQITVRPAAYVQYPITITPDMVLAGDSGEAERLFRREAERHSGMIPNTIGA